MPPFIDHHHRCDRPDSRARGPRCQSSACTRGRTSRSSSQSSLSSCSAA